MTTPMSNAEVAQHFAEADALFGRQSATEAKPDPLARFVEIQKRLREIEEEEKRLKAEAEPLQEHILNEWADKGQTKATLAGMTAYVRMDFYCNKRGGVPTETVCDVLRTIGLADMVAPSYNAAKLKSIVKEWNESGQVPEELQALLSYDTVPRLVAIKA